MNKLKYLKRKLSETNEKRQERLQKERDQQKCQKKLLIREKRDFKKGEMVKTNKFLEVSADNRQETHQCPIHE